MAQKATPDPKAHRGFGDIIAVVLICAGLLLLVAQFSFDRYDISSVRMPANKPAHNWIGPIGAHLAHASFFMFGGAAYLIPWLLFLVGASEWVESLTYLKRRWPWAVALIISGVGLMHLMDSASLFARIRIAIAAPSFGGFIGKMMFEYFFWMVGTTGSVIIYAAVYLISLLFLTNFQLGHWIRGWMGKEAEDKLSNNEAELEKRANELERKKKDLERQVARTTTATPEPVMRPVASGVGADMKPVPAPTVRDLSVPQAKPARTKKQPVTEPPKEVLPPDEGEVIPAKELAAAKTADILGDKSVLPTKPADTKPEGKTETKPEEALVEKTEAKPDGEKPAEGAAEPDIKITGLTPPKPKPIRKKPITVASTPLIGNYQLPSMDFLQHPDMTLKPTESKEELMANARLMQQTLAQFDIEVQLGDITKGPTITRYELHPAPGVKLEKIAGLSNNIAAVLKAERINILAPVPGKSSVGIEVPNLVKTKVIMRDLLESDEWRNTKARIPLALGKDVYGHPIIADLGDMPHLLIAGSTGSGKSVCINSIIASLLYRFSPDQLRFVMIDPKVVELQQYNALPHLVVPVVTDPKKVLLALRWVVNEMEKRYQIFARVGVRNIKSFNERPKNKPIPSAELELPLMAKKEKVEPGAEGFAVEVDEQIVVPREEDIVIPEKLSYIVVIIDELADLMLVAPADVEMAIARITQMARAAGIHCIVATQRPSVDVITGVIKSNIPARIAFQVAAAVDSRTILDGQGANKLLGKGDMLYLPPGSAKLIRAQGALITDQEIQSIVDFIALQGKPSYEVEIHKQLSKPANSFGDESGIDEDEEIIQQCIEVIRSEQKASVSLLQRRLRLGYTRAARIMDELENRGIVGPSKGAEPRDILIDLDGGGADGAGQ